MQALPLAGVLYDVNAMVDIIIQIWYFLFLAIFTWLLLPKLMFAFLLNPGYNICLDLLNKIFAEILASLRR